MITRQQVVVCLFLIVVGAGVAAGIVLGTGSNTGGVADV